MTGISCFHIWYFRHSLNFILHQGYTSWSGLYTIALSFGVCVSCWLTKRQWLSKPVGNTAIQYFLSMRHSRIVLCYCFSSSMPISGQISVDALSIISRLPCFIYTTPKTRRKRFSDWLFYEVNSISHWLI
jgi:hypothetical protein